jgi:hypothetical protein
MQSDLVTQVFLEKHTLLNLARRRPGVPLANFRYRFRQTLHRFVSRPHLPALPQGPLILLADGLFFHFRRQPWVLYLIALRSCAGGKAVFLDPVLFPKKESAMRWQQALEMAIPSRAKPQIRALVADNLNGMKKIAKRQGWVLQLCHFHLIQKFQIQYRRQRRALKGGILREEIYRRIRQAIEVSEGSLLNASIARLAQLAQTPTITYRIQAMVREFLASIQYYRSYLMHPELNLPSTTNTVESMGCIVRDLFRRSHSASNPHALLQWATALIRLRKELNCNGKHHQQN